MVPSLFSQGGKFCMEETLSRIPSLRLCRLEGMIIPLTPIGKLSSPGFKGAPSQAGGSVLGTRGVEASGSFPCLSLGLTHIFRHTLQSTPGLSPSLSVCLTATQTHTLRVTVLGSGQPSAIRTPSPLPSL